MDKILSRVQTHRDWVAALLLLAAMAYYGAFRIDFGGPPFEDAAMLMRYADNLAHGHGIVWNVGEAPVDGATDFLFMASVAALVKGGLAIGRAVRVLGLGAHVLTVFLVYWVNRKIWKRGILAAFVPSLYLALGTGLWYVAAYFGTTFFALFGAITWALALVLVQSESPAGWIDWAFAISALITGLIRPEGVLLAGFMLAAIVVVKGWGRSRKTLAAFAIIMLVFGGAYFAWHWSYFGSPLPNPYYKKGAGLLHWDSFWESLGYLVRFAGPFGLAFILGLRGRATTRRTIAFSLPLVLFAASFVLVSNETNFGGRFQYVLWPLVLMSFYPLVEGIGAELGVKWNGFKRESVRLAVIATALVGVIALLNYGAAQACRLTSQQQGCGNAVEADGRYDVARLLAEYRGRGYVIATSEAGLLPLYSGWTAVDTWGLNDAWIAKHGEVTAEYLETYHPQLIVFHAYFSPLVPPRTTEKDLDNDWHRMTLTLRGYAESHDYLLAAAFGDSPYETHYYYVRRDFPDAEKIARAISSMRAYYWYATGKKSINYAGISRP